MASELEEKITEALEDGKLPCPMAFRIAKELKIPFNSMLNKMIAETPTAGCTVG